MRLSQILKVARQTIDEVRYLPYLENKEEESYLIFHTPSAYTLQFLQAARARYNTLEQGYVVPVLNQPKKLSSTSWTYPLPSPLKWVQVRTLIDDIQVEAWE
jgi:hypothetical protein